MRGVKATIDGKPTRNPSDYSVTEDSTPLDPSDTAGGVGQFTVSRPTLAGDLGLYGREVLLEDSYLGSTSGYVGPIGIQAGMTDFTVDSRLSLLTVERDAAPHNGTLETAIHYYLGLVGITSGIYVDPEIKDEPAVLLGWTGVVWDQLKKLASALAFEISLVSNNVVVRPPRTRRAVNYRNSSAAFSVDPTQLARTVEMYYYNGSWQTNGLAYPPGGWNEDVQIYTVNAGETLEFDLTLSSSLLSVDQPVCVDWVDRTHSSSSVYSVTGSDGLIIPPLQWTDNGGSVTVAIGPDSKKMVLTIVGSTEEEYAPYKIAMPSGASDAYSSLRVVGEGFFYDKVLKSYATSVNPDRVTQEVGVTVDNEFIASEEQADRLSFWVKRRYGKPRLTVNVQTGGINRIGDSGSYRYPLISEFNAAWAGQDIAAFNAAWAGKTIAEFNAYWRDLVQAEFANQAFGNIAGAQVQLPEGYFRIRSATTSPSGIDYFAEEDFIAISDFNAVWNGEDMAAFNSEWAGKTIRGFNLKPLGRAA